LQIHSRGARPKAWHVLHTYVQSEYKNTHIYMLILAMKPNAKSGQL
jgi:hypothetical protein